jgi:hypothetical protein
VDTQVRAAIITVYKKTCQYCLREYEEACLQVDHIDPISRGGSDSLLNLTLACESCNCRKTDLKLKEPGRSLLLTIAENKVNDILVLLHGLPRERCIRGLRPISLGELLEAKKLDEELEERGLT